VTGEQLPGASGTGNGFTTSATYDCWLGRPTRFTDINAVPATFAYGTASYDLDQLAVLTRAQGTGAEGRTSYEYGLGGPSPFVAANGALRTAIHPSTTASRRCTSSLTE
jgi:hypothetical protein